MVYEEIAPHFALSKHVACYFFLEVEKEVKQEELVFPDGTPGLMFVENAAFTRYATADKKGGKKIAGSYLFGQKTKPVNYVFDTPGLFCFGVKFQPHGLKTFHDISNAELTDTMIQASLVFGKRFCDLEEALYTTSSIQQKKEILDRYFQKALPKEELPNQLLVEKILGLIHRKKGQIGVSQLLQHFQLNYKRLERLFKKFVGVSPKTYCCITRFNASLFHQRKNRFDNLTQLAYSAGYFDQMHFIKEFRNFTNSTPKNFFKKELGPISGGQCQLVIDRLA